MRVITLGLSETLAGLTVTVRAATLSQMGSRCLKLVLLFAIGLLCARGEHWLASHAFCPLEEASAVSEACENTEAQNLQPSVFAGLINPTELQFKSCCGTVFDFPASPSLARLSEAHIVRGPPSC